MVTGGRGGFWRLVRVVGGDVMHLFFEYKNIEKTITFSSFSNNIELLRSVLDDFSCLSTREGAQ